MFAFHRFVHNFLYPSATTVLEPFGARVSEDNVFPVGMWRERDGEREREQIKLTAFS